MAFDEDRAWQVIEQQRLAIADVLGGLSAEEWEMPSLCAGWRIRDVAAHLCLTPLSPPMSEIARTLVRARGDYNRAIDRLTRAAAERPTAQLVSDIHDNASSRKLPALTNFGNTLFDVIVHGQDIAIPLGRHIGVPATAAAAAASRAWQVGWPVWNEHRLDGFRLTATDLDWTIGSGAQVRGPIVALLLVITGRPAGLDHLAGEGVRALAARLRVERHPH
ncbi:maleylpyruvate isomerase family mycothiol-dependent enzyme [Nocardia sp. NPDC046473]|uniref:maleylpyruvate isomerase family mycothiol-dependent enzyme n=1 Tax=Nocardia sp. NPDC046473 TaxID=3155733 RepID=UPI0033E1E235